MILWSLGLPTLSLRKFAHSVEYSAYARDIWNELEERYGKANSARIFKLKKYLA